MQINLARYPQETARILQRDIFWFFFKDEEFVSTTINDSNIDLDKFPASKVSQPAKKLESSKSTAKHIKQVSHEPQAAKVNLIRHQAQGCHIISFKENKESSSLDNLTPEINKNINSMKEQMKECHKQVESSSKNKQTQKKDA